ncbi:agmatine deiminase family protein [Latilactobacillus fuchuensis]|uniref:agmatine deiminase family protein n=1 Tax=Latilactobacillus fuchuensis TaxID=164393 RepID=UPI0039AF8951
MFRKLSLLLFAGSLATTIPQWTHPQGQLFTGRPRLSDHYYWPFKKDIRQFERATTSIPIPYGDIWIKDVAPVVTSRLVKFRYSPDYLPKKQSAALESAFSDWIDQQHFDYLKSAIILDGGNCIYNGRDTVIITTRVLQDNPAYSRSALIQTLKSQLQVTHVILIAPEPGDVLGHADGQVHFLSPDCLLLGDFSGHQKIKQQLQRALPQTTIIDLPSSYQAAGQYDSEIPSAKGLYINMTETTSTVYVPQYGLKMDQAIIKLVQHHTSKKVQAVDVTHLSTLGGSVNCLTWYCPNNLLPAQLKKHANS